LLRVLAAVLGKHDAVPLV